MARPVGIGGSAPLKCDACDLGLQCKQLTQMKSTTRCLCRGSTCHLHLVASITGLGYLMSGGPAALINAQVPNALA